MAKVDVVCVVYAPETRRYLNHAGVFLMLGRPAEQC
jgi:hypothetical protein